MILQCPDEQQSPSGQTDCLECHYSVLLIAAAALRAFALFPLVAAPS